MSTLPDLQNASDERRSWIVRSLALVVVAAFVLAGLTGMFGVASATATAHSPRGLSVLTTAVSSGDETLTVHYTSWILP